MRFSPLRDNRISEEPLVRPALKGHADKHAITTMNATSAPGFSHPRTKVTCPLCHESPVADVAAHLDVEIEGIAEPTFAMIKVLHPGWFEDHGACAVCWSFYRNLVRVLNVSGCFDPRFQIGERGSNASVNPDGNGFDPNCIADPLCTASGRGQGGLELLGGATGATSGTGRRRFLK